MCVSRRHHEPHEPHILLTSYAGNHGGVMLGYWSEGGRMSSRWIDVSEYIQPFVVFLSNISS